MPVLPRQDRVGNRESLMTAQAFDRAQPIPTKRNARSDTLLVPSIDDKTPLQMALIGRGRPKDELNPDKVSEVCTVPATEFFLGGNRYV